MKTAPSILPDISRQLDGGKDLLAEVECLAGKLTELMEEIHRMAWRADIQHSDNAAFVLVAPRIEKRRASV